jgi:hypothetical protein
MQVQSPFGTYDQQFSRRETAGDTDLTNSISVRVLRRTIHG